MSEKDQVEYALYDVEFVPGGKTYTYIAEKDVYSDGEIVVVNVGANNREAVVRIVAKKDFSTEGLSISSGCLKHILRVASGEERIEFATAKKHTRIKKSAGEFTKGENLYVSEGIQPDGSFIFSYEDYGVDSFDGMDIETTYILDAENTEKLRLYLAKKHVGSLESMLAQECGYGYRKKAAIELFIEAGVNYKSSIWIS